MTARIPGIEYQGNFVKVLRDAGAEGEFVAYVPQRSFCEDPYDKGDVVLAAWNVEYVRLLA